MLRHLILTSFFIASMANLVVYAQQESTSSQPAMPAVQEASEEQGGGGLMSGEKPFTLMVDENVGELIYTFDEETKELESITAKRGVIFASEDMTLNSDEMEYVTLNSSLVATGKRVVVRMGEMIITCQVFKYNPETQEGEFQGDPIVYQRDKQGKVTETAGRIISVVNVNGKFQMQVLGGGGRPTYVKMGGNPQANAPLEKKTLAPGQTGATIVLNNNPSGLAGSPAVGAASSTTRGGGLIPAPQISEEAAPTGATTNSSTSAANSIDLDNPADVQKLGGQIAQ